MDKTAYVYIVSSKGRRLYIGVTSQLQIRMTQHKSKQNPHSFTARYNIDRLVHYECFSTMLEAIARESRLKNLCRTEKIALIVAHNPDWQDLSEAWGKAITPFTEATLKQPTTF